MAGGIKISIVDDFKSFLSGLKYASDGVEDMADSLDDVAQAAADASSDSVQSIDKLTDALGDVVDAARLDGDRAGRELAEGIDDGRKRADDSTDKVRRSFAELADASRRESKKIGDDLGDNVKRGARDSEDALDDVKGEAADTGREMAQSFSGSADDIVGSLQEVAASAFRPLGPQAALAGAAVAVGLGIGWAKWQEESQAAKERVTEVADAMIEANSRVLAADFLNQQLRDIYTGAEGAAISVDNLREAAEETGVAEAELARAFAGDQDSRARALAIVQTAYAEAAADAISLDNDVANAGVVRQAELGRWLGDLERLGGEHDTAAGKFEGYSTAVEAGQRAIDESVGQTRAEYERLRDTMQLPPTTTPRVTIPVSADTTEFDRTVRNLRPVVVATVRAGQAAV